TEGELRQAYESHFGEKMLVRMIMWPKEEEAIVRRKIFPMIRDDDKEFVRLAKQQVVPELASHAGETELARGGTGHEEVEKIAFDLPVGDISPVIALPEGIVVFRVLKRLPPQKEVKLDQVRSQLEQEVIEAKLRARVIPQVYAKLRQDANPILLLEKQVTEDELKRDVVRELKDSDQSIVKPRAPSTAPGGN
ncbi:MAG TPA: peptidylprolyl isomerase, partial [Gemmataceae bacterium]|nr:peptidylprolyl isomerase [Gemmataceae bacterium]